MPIHLSRQDFEELVATALDTLPEGFRKYLVNVVVEVHDRPQPHVLSQLHISNPHGLLGFYRGVPLTRQSVEQTVSLPEYIYIYQENIQRMCHTPQELIEQVQTTVLHEVGHHFGLDEEELEELGYG